MRAYLSSFLLALALFGLMLAATSEWKMWGM